MIGITPFYLTLRAGKSTCKHHYSPYSGQLTEALRPEALRDGVSRIGDDWGAVTMAKHLGERDIRGETISDCVNFAVP